MPLVKSPEGSVQTWSRIGVGEGGADVRRGHRLPSTNI